MGVHGLWSVLAPAGHTVPLSRLAGSTLAVDLSGWVCQAIKAKSLAQKVHKPHLRNLFFRVSTFYRLGASLVFVIDGEATQLKWVTLDKREGRRGEEERRKTGRRTLLQSYVNECCNMLDCLGVPYIRSKGEAEALCSILNYTGVADGVLTNDSDAFLYGATTVYRDLHTTERCPTVECYTMKDIQEKLALDRSDLVALALLLGCDYCPQGVAGVGKETSLHFLRATKTKSGPQTTSDVLDLFQEWRNGHISEDDIESKVELAVFRKAMRSPTFPQEEVIREFMSPPDITSSVAVGDASKLGYWRHPQLHSTQVMCSHDLQWRMEYTAGKMVPLLAQWALRQAIRGGGGGEKPTISPYRILKSCRLNGDKCYRVQWQNNTSGLESGDPVEKDEDDVEDESGVPITVERQEDMEKAFPGVCAVFRQTAETQLKEQAKALAEKHRRQQRVNKTQGRRRGTKKSPQTSPSSVLPQILQEMVLKSPVKDTLVPSTSSSSSSSAATNSSLEDIEPQKKEESAIECEESPVPCLSQRLAERRKTKKTNSSQISRGKETLVQTSLLSTARVVRQSRNRALNNGEHSCPDLPSKLPMPTESCKTVDKHLNLCCSIKAEEDEFEIVHAQLPTSGTLNRGENPRTVCSSKLSKEEEANEEVLHDLVTPPLTPTSKRFESPNGLKFSHSPKKLALMSDGGVGKRDAASPGVPCIVLSDSGSEEDEKEREEDEYDVPLVERSMASRNSGNLHARSVGQGTANDPIVL